MRETLNLDLARRYIDTLSSGAGPDDIGQFFAPDAIQEELPNRLLPYGATRDVEAMKQARARGRTLLSAERFDVLNAVASGDQVAMELRWSGTVGAATGPFKAGQSLRARFAVFLEFREGRIARQRNYDCFEPW
jgi:ketosteroid isomerase-like protein